MCKDVGPGGFVPQHEPQTPQDPPQAFVDERPRIEAPLICESEPQTAKNFEQKRPRHF